VAPESTVASELLVLVLVVLARALSRAAALSLARAACLVLAFAAAPG